MSIKKYVVFNIHSKFSHTCVLFRTKVLEVFRYKKEIEQTVCEYDKIVKIVHEWLKFEKHFAKVSDLVYYLFQIHLHFKGRDLKNPAKPKAESHQRQQCQGRGAKEPLFDDSPLSIAGFLCLDSIFIIAVTEASDCFGSPGSLSCREENVRALWTECSHLPSSPFFIIK